MREHCFEHFSSCKLCLCKNSPRFHQIVSDKRSKIKISRQSMPLDPPNLTSALHADTYLPPPLGQKAERNPVSIKSIFHKLMIMKTWIGISSLHKMLFVTVFIKVSHFTKHGSLGLKDSLGTVLPKGLMTCSKCIFLQIYSQNLNCSLSVI